MSLGNSADSVPRILEPRDLPALAAQLHSSGRIVVWTNGCFDLFHVGHLRSLQAAKRHGDRLIVGVNSDASVQRLKGFGRPVIPATDRAEMVAAQSCVDYVVIFEEDTAEESVRVLRPNIFCKGYDYAPPGGKPVLEAATLATFACRIAYLPFVEGLSTTALIAKIKSLPEGGS